MAPFWQAKQWSLRTRLIVLTSSLSLLFMFLTILLVDIQGLEKEQQALNQKNALLHEFLLTNFNEVLLTGNPDSGLDLIEKLSTRTDLKAMLLKDMEGNIRFRYGDLSSQDQSGMAGFWSALFDQDYILNAKVNIVSKQIGEAVYYYKGPSFLQRLGNNLLTDLMLLPFLLLAALLVAHRASRAFTQPLEQLADQMNHPDAESGQLALPVEQQNRDLQKLYRGFNRLQDRILEGIQALQNQVEEKAYLASHDSLTGILNRAGFDEQFELTFQQRAKQKSIEP